MSKFAILAPVPLEHLEAGEDISSKAGFVAFGSKKWELFRDADEQRKGQPVPVLIYPSYENVASHLNCVLSWFGWYCGHVESKGGGSPARNETQTANHCEIPGR